MDYTKKRTRTRELINKYGTTITYTQGGQTYSSPGAAQTKKNLLGSNMTAERYLEVVFPAGVDPKPQVNARVEVNGVAFRVYEVETIAPGSVDLVYKVRAR